MSDHHALPLLLTPMPRRRFLQACVVAESAAMLGALGLPTGARAAKREIRYLNNEPDPNTIAFLKKMAVEYEGASGVKLQIETIPVLETCTKVTTAIKAGKPYDSIIFR